MHMMLRTYGIGYFPWPTLENAFWNTSFAMTYCVLGLSFSTPILNFSISERIFVLNMWLLGARQGFLGATCERKGPKKNASYFPE